MNTVAEGARLAAAVDRPNFFLLADFYHVDQNGEPLEDILRFRDRLIHFHICSARRDMLSEEDIPFVTARLNLLAQIGYRGGISYEGAWPEDSSEANAATVRILRSAAKRCGLAE